MVESTDTATIEGFVRDTVSDKVSLLATEEHAGYRNLSGAYPHETVVHNAREYVRGSVHPSHVEGFWCLIKRGIMGSLHSVPKDYLPLHLNEFSFRNDSRDNEDIFDTVLRKA